MLFARNAPDKFASDDNFSSSLKSATLLLLMYSTRRFVSLSMFVSFSMLLYEIHSSSSVAATPSKFSIFLMRFFPRLKVELKGAEVGY